MSNDKLGFLSEVVDRFLTVQYFVSGGGATDATVPVNQRLYEAARAEAGDQSLTGTAARALDEAVDPGDIVFIPTGFIVPPWNRTEADGPMGTPGLSRALSLGLEATPIVVTERANINAVEQVLAASGLQVADLEEAVAGYRKVAIVSMPVDEDAEAERAAELLDTYDPSAVITIEKPSRTADGTQRNGAAYDISGTTAGADLLIEQARERGAVTVGIGDGGNEIGMARIRDTVEEMVSPEIAAATETDHLVVAATANWGAYGIEACLAAVTGDPKVMHDREVEKRIQQAAANAGLVDPMTGLADGWLDGMPPKVGRNVVDQLRMTVELQLTEPWQLRQWNEWSDRDNDLQAAIDDHAARLRSEE